MKKSFLLLTLLWGALSAWAHDAEVDGIFYNLNKANKTATVTFKGDKYDAYDSEYAGDVVIPKAVTYNGITYSVTSLGANCFRDCRNLTSITIPNSVTNLEAFCFGDCSSIERMVVDAANPVYDSRENCNAIIHTSTNNLVVGCKNSKIPNSVTSLGNYCFRGCSGLTSITIPNSVTSLGYACFYNCRSLTSITIPNSVTSLGGYCFAGCSSLERIEVDAANTVYDSRENCNAIIHTATNKLIAGCKNSKIPNSVKSLGNHCFWDCSGLTSITIPNSVTSLGGSCFYGCSSLERIEVDAANTVYDSRENSNAIIHTSTNELVVGCKNSKIPNSVTSLGRYCFHGCIGLTSITIPNSVTSLGRYCFHGCIGLTSITIPNSVTSLGNSCFNGCSHLTSITIPNSVTSLGDYCFYNCSGLSSITIPSSVTSLGNGCFSGCSSLERIVVDAANPVYDSRENSNAIIVTATNKLVAGCKNSKIPTSVTSLGHGCFFNCIGLTSITIPNSVTSLGEWCFDDCSSLTSISIPNSVTSLGYGCFYECRSLTSITIPNSVTSLGDYCFSRCSRLTSITIPNSVTSLGRSCFSECSGLTSITIPNSVTSLGEECLEGCSSLTSIYMLPTTPPGTVVRTFLNTPLETVYVVDENAKKAYKAGVPWFEYEIVVMPTGIK